MWQGGQAGRIASWPWLITASLVQNPRMKASDINSLHRLLEQRIRGVLGFANLKILPPSASGDWTKATVDTRLPFELLPAGGYPEQAARDTGSRCSVFPLHPNVGGDPLASRYWVSWFEVWLVKVIKIDLHLCTAGWSVFAGLLGRDKRQVIRAEWDQLPITGSPKVGQPHWHVDRPLEYESADDTSELAGLHLAMGTWNSTEDHPSCWQRSAEKQSDLVDWGERTLRYLQSELSCTP